ncbi:MAG: thiamine pyrophosphate-binding protein [Candidatus Binatia bacterium]
MTGGELLAQMLKAEGVEVVFGIIDGTYFGFYSKLAKLGIKLITPRHETSAAHMAGAYARLTGKLGVCMASNGPGVANVLPGVAVENGEGNRVLLITSSRRTGIIYPDRGGTFQYFNQVAVIKPMTKWSGAVPSFERIPELVRRAFRISFSKRPGVVHVDVPENIMNGKFKNSVATLRPQQYRLTEAIRPAPHLVHRAAELLADASCPLVHAGTGVLHAQASDELHILADLLQAPVSTSWGGRGSIGEQSDLSLPMQYVDLNNKVRNEADVVLVLGSRMGETDWWGKAPYWRRASEQAVIQVDVDEETLGLNRPVELAVLSDVREFLRALIDELDKVGPSSNLQDRRARVAKLNETKRAARADLDKALMKRGEPMHPSHVATVCRKFFKDDAILVTDGGNTVIWSNFYHEVRAPGTMLSTFKFGMLGAGVSQALGAKIARPNKQVYCIIGDGAMGFHCQEVETAVRNDLPVVYLVMCDRQWGMVKMNQQFALKPVKTLVRKSLNPEETINTDLGAIRFDKLAEAMGGHGELVSHPDELEPALQRCLASGLPAVIHVDVDPVAHMWAPSLRVFKDMHEEPKG